MEYYKKDLECLVDQKGDPISIYYPAKDHAKMEAVSRSGYEAGLRFKAGLEASNQSPRKSFWSWLKSFFKLS